MSLKNPTSGFMAMKGGGYYSKATLGAKDVIDAATPLILDALASMDIADIDTPFTVSDMGCADGGTSIDMIRAVLAHVRGRVPNRPLQMVYTDLPRNDFSQVFRNAHGLGDIAGYTGQIENVHVFASATSFHDEIFSPGSLNLGFSATASHYISETPGVISDHVHMVGASGAEREAFVAQGRRDWTSMLSNRARELAVGGKLALFNFGIDEQGRYLGGTDGINMFDTFNALWAELSDEGIITNAEYVNTNFPQTYRTVDEFTEPFVTQGHPVHTAGLRLAHVETRVVKCPFARDFGEHRDAARFAKEYIPTLRSWSEATFVGGLSKERPPEGIAEIIDEFYGRYEARVAQAPAGHAMDYVHCYLIVEKS
ncbi:MAG: class I SAM-dependent methyltransferase [Gammaproteobacteria bacterium]|nr:class I SAM-dependent methyltransferase [Gammaproteobacteria bacterium]